jgi:hypothetical protein
MPSKLWSFFIGLFLVMTYGLTHTQTPSFLTPECAVYADDDDEIDTEEEISDELDEVTEEEDFLDDIEEAEEDQIDDVISEMMEEDDEEDENAEEDETVEIPAGSENTQEGQEAQVDNALN